jgi:hypothetical protein
VVDTWFVAVRLEDSIMQTRPGWAPETKHLFTAEVPSGDGRHYLVVERLPTGGWDWVTWGQGSHAQSVHGSAPTAAQAMIAAEHAAAMLGADLAGLAPMDKQGPDTQGLQTATI